MPRPLEKRPQRSLCGIFNCAECDRQKTNVCSGCMGGNLIRRRRGGDPCIIYSCVRAQKIESCWQCAKAECPLAQGLLPYCATLAGADHQVFAEKINFLLRRREARTKAKVTNNHSEPRFTRARWYLAALDEMNRRGVQRICSYDLAIATGVKSALVRRDLSCLGHLGTPSVGYDIHRLRSSISDSFGLGLPCFWVGATKLLAQPGLIEEFAACNCRIGGIYALDAELADQKVADLEIKPLFRLKEDTLSTGVYAAVLALPPHQAQAALDTLVDAGITGILSLVNAPLTAPPHIVIQQADLPSQLFLLMARCRK